MQASDCDTIIETSSDCMQRTLQVIGDRWSGLIIKELLAGNQRFSRIQNSLPGISPRTLSQRLDSLEDHGIIAKAVFTESPPRIEYTLTDKGNDLLPILRALSTWGSKYPHPDHVTA